MKINKQTKLPMCSDEVLKVSYSADGIDFVVQNVYTMGKSPGGLSGHAAALLQDQSGTLQDGPKCTSTRMIISGGTNTDRIKKNKIKGVGTPPSDDLNVWMLDLVTWCWSKPVMPSMCIDLKSRNVDWKYMIHNLIDEIKAARTALANIQSSQNNHNNKKLSSKKKNLMNEIQKRKALEI